ncbi:hypothetical protein [Nitrospirillum iridis]|uniref:Uncharacterized protein n=1 Tax=Nitrospirillum iridis TaxID=765888 RepID=A0A7X0B6F6_9PROT|nr:hypothetical protein [Nitrospirillum iridis]MBB6255336.1 hypothetical protein [Nitrospirillum iridis]
MTVMFKSVLIPVGVALALIGFAIAAGSAMAAGSAGPCGPAPVLSLKRLDAPPAVINGDAFVASVNGYAAKAKARGACLAKVAAASDAAGRSVGPAILPAPSGD